MVQEYSLVLFLFNIELQALTSTTERDQKRTGYN